MRALLVVDLGDDRHLGDREARAEVQGRLGREEREDVLVQRDADLGLGAADVALDPGRHLGEDVAQGSQLALEVVRAGVDEGAAGHLARQLGGELVREEVAGGRARRALDVDAVLLRVERECERRRVRAEETRKRRRVERRGCDVDGRDAVVGHLAADLLVVAVPFEGAVRLEPLELVEVRLRIRERDPAVDLTGDERLVALGEERVELRPVVRLREADDLPLAGDVERDEVGLGPERGLQVVLEVDALPAELAEDPFDRAISVRELAEERAARAPVRRVEARVHADEDLRGRRRDARPGGARRRPFSAPCGGESKRGGGENEDEGGRDGVGPRRQLAPGGCEGRTQGARVSVIRA